MVDRAPILDPEAFAALADIVGDGALRDLAGEAEREIAQRLDRLAGADTAARDIAQIAHDLTGLAGQVGLTALAHAAREMQRIARAGDNAALPAAAGAVRALGPPSLAALRAELRATTGG